MTSRIEYLLDPGLLGRLRAMRPKDLAEVVNRMLLRAMEALPDEERREWNRILESDGQETLDGLGSKARRLADNYDDDAWDAQESGDEALYEALFFAARAYAAFAYWCDGDFGESLYEALNTGELEPMLERLREVVDVLG